MSDMLTQEEIDAMMSGNKAPSEEDKRSTLTQEETDIIGEVGNISMSQSTIIPNKLRQININW